MKAKIIVELNLMFIDFIMEKAGLKTAEELKGYLKAAYEYGDNGDFKGGYDISVEVEE